MQGQRGTIGSLPEMLDFDHGNTSNDAALDQQICWNGTRNPVESRIPDYIQSPTDMDVGFGNSIGRERQNLGRWCLGEPSSRNSQGEVNRDERKPDFGWSSSVDACGEAGLRLEERRYEPTNNLSLDNNVNTIFTPSSNSDAASQHLNLNAGFTGHGGDSSQVMECPNTYKYNVTENERTRPTGNSDPFLLPAASTGFLVGENDGRPGCSLEGRRVSCKRKTMEGHLGQSSLSGSCSYFQHTESGARTSVPAHYNAGINISTPSQEGNPRPGAGGRELTSDSIPDSNVGRSSESSHRNFRVRINPSNQQNTIPSTRFSSGRAARHSSGSSSQHSPGLLPVDHSLDLRPAPVLDNMSSQNQPVVHVPALPQNAQSLRWNSGSSSRTGGLSNSVFMGDRDAPLREEASSRSMARQILGHPIFVPATELRNSARLSAGSSSRNLTGGNASIPGNVASTSRTGPSSSTHPASAPTWVPHHNSHPQFPRRLSEYVRRSLFSAGGNESGNQGSNFLPMRSGSSSSQEAVHSSGAANLGHHQPHPRSASWLERHGDGLGLPYSLRTLAAGGEGNNRLVSEQICNVLGLMRRGESLRFEDVMILDQSMLFGVADIHDRHRDMRLDVDNMSYEELLALEERIGNVNTGLSEEIISNRLKHKKYIAEASQAETETEPCCICQEEYNEGDDLGMLECGHDFHSDCIKQWLTHKNLCPICKTTALAT
ncbi:putative transcription factor C2H2 family [Rosa chinensis]|uniref:RING-type E3 ubiquitin transferase n=1 Tax=Rosa chinensis TaxID=74649 RepID=A0A2P6Q0P8_ROSCH|nr:probable E3 ubiquitin-protein ligase RHG1A isoform X1 [Rosa chinensis]PRQ27716.1 putative transcription factor C2H2 family [Rosa chinensis]